jgi:hypothetical protein
MGAVFIGIGVAAVAAGGVMYFLGASKDSKAAEENAFMITPTVSPSGGGVFARWTF